MTITISNARWGGYDLKLEGIRGRINAKNMDEVLCAVAHYFAKHDKPIHQSEKCPFCRRIIS